MQEIVEYRQKLMDRIEAAVQDFRRACEAVPDPHRALEEGGWNVHQIAAHTRDVQRQVYGLRVRRSIEEQNPLFENFDQDEWMRAHYDPKEPMEWIIGEFSASVARVLAQLRDLPPEAWSRPSRHETLGTGFTTQTWVERGLSHVEEHLASIRSASG